MVSAHIEELVTGLISVLRQLGDVPTTYIDFDFLMTFSCTNVSALFYHYCEIKLFLSKSYSNAQTDLHKVSKTDPQALFIQHGRILARFCVTNILYLILILLTSLIYL